MPHQIIQGECLTVMKTMQEDSMSCVVTDPPYGLKFMGKDWDHGIPGIEFWKEALRVCKPGAWMLAFGGTRTHHRLICAIEDAGWEIRDCIMWVYGSGFPKGKGCLKPAYEPIVLCRKPGCKVSENFLNIDECRIGSTVETWPKTRAYCRSEPGAPSKGVQSCGESPNGRWPANIILDDESGKLLDGQSGFSKSPGKTYRGAGGQNGKLSPINSQGFVDCPNDSGGASRFFYCAKASTRERNEGLENPNTHCTIKPLALMQYLIKLVHKDGIILDPFAGSGTTILAAKYLGFYAIGIEISEEYCEIARKRLEL